MRNAGLEEAQAEIKIARRNNNNLRYACLAFVNSENAVSIAVEMKTTLRWRLKR